MFANRSSQQFTHAYNNHLNIKPLLSTANNELELRKKIQHYSFLLSDKIGKGYSSTVYKGLNDITGQQVAVKVIDLRSLRDQTSKIMLNTEIECFKQVKHKHLLRFQNAYYTVNNCYIITQYCAKGDLSRLIKERRMFTEQQAGKLFYQIYSGYLHFHLAGYIHRDLKPANIFISNNDQLKIADFGFCKKPTLVERQNYNVGTPVYMPKESLAANIYNQKTDVWSLGVTLYEMVFGQVPFKGKTQLELRSQIDKGMVQFPIAVPISSELKVFISACLVNDSFRRLSIRDMHKYPWMKRVIQKMQGKQQIKQTIIPNIQDQYICHTYRAVQCENEEDTCGTKKHQQQSKEMRISSPTQLMAHRKSKQSLTVLGNQNRRSINSMQKLKIFNPKKVNQTIDLQRQSTNRSNSMSNQPSSKAKKQQFQKQNNLTDVANKQNIPQNRITLSISTQPSIINYKLTPEVQKKVKKSKSGIKSGVEKVVSLINYFRLLYKIYDNITVAVKEIADDEVKSELNRLWVKMGLQLKSNFNLHLQCVSTKKNIFGFNSHFWSQFTSSPRWQMYCYVINQYRTKYEYPLTQTYSSQRVQYRQWSAYFIMLYDITKPALSFGGSSIKQKNILMQILYLLQHFINICNIIQQNNWEDFSEIYMDSRDITQDHFQVGFSNYQLINTQIKQKYEQLKASSF